MRVNARLAAVAVSHLCIVTAVCLLLSGCRTGLGDIYTPKELAQLLQKDGGWRLLAIPDSKYVPASEITIREPKQDRGGIRWVGAFEGNCVPAAAISIAQGQAPSLDWKKDVAFSLAVAANIQGVKVGPEGGKVSKVVLDLDSYGAHALDLQKLNLYIADPANKIPDVCLTFLRTPDNYLVNEVLQVTRGRYTLYDSNNAKIKVTSATLGDYLGEVSAGMTVSADGSLEFTRPTTVAVRVVGYNGLFVPLGPGEERSGTDRLDSVWRRITSEYGKP